MAPKVRRVTCNTLGENAFAAVRFASAMRANIGSARFKFPLFSC